MPGGVVALEGTDDVNRIEAPVTFKAYLMCAFAAFGGIFFGYDSGYINGVLGMPFLVHLYTGLPFEVALKNPAAFQLPVWQHSLIVGILSAGTFVGALLSGDAADFWGRRNTVVSSCCIFLVGVVIQMAATRFEWLVAGRAVAGLGVGGVSCTIILYMSEIAPRKIRGAIVSGYQFCITIGLLLASVVCYGTQGRMDTGSFRIPIAIQFAWALILGFGLLMLPESPRYYVRKGNHLRARKNLAILRQQDLDSELISDELAEIIANHELEQRVMHYRGGYWHSWALCFQGSLFNPSSNLRRTILGTSLQMMQQWTGVNFVFYFGTTFFQTLGTIPNPFLISLITTLVNVLSTPVSFWTIEKFGRRPLLIWGALGMVVCQFIVAVVGTVTDQNKSATSAMISFICLYIFFFASTWGPGAWVVIGEIFPLPIRARGVALSTASNWLWNCIIAVITPFMVGADKGNLGAKVFFIWGSLCFACFVYAWLLVYETKGLSLEQVDQMMNESKPMTSSKWKPKTTFAHDLAAADEKERNNSDPNSEYNYRSKSDGLVVDRDQDRR